MQEAYEITRENEKRSAERGKGNHDNKVRSSVLEEGDRVLVRNMTPRGGTGKLRSHWEDYLQSCASGKDLPIYEVVPEQGKGRDSRILHRNLLLPCNHLPLEMPLKVVKQSKKKSIRKDKGENNAAQPESSSDDEDDWHCHLPMQPLPTMQSQADENTDLTEMDVNESGEGPVLQRDENQSESHLLDQRGIPNQVETNFPDEVALEDSIPAPLSPGLSGNYNEAVQTPGRPRRERQAPKVFPYNELGKPVCYSIGPPANHTFWYQPLPYGHKAAETQWGNNVPFLHHQPVSLHGY